MKVPSIIDFLFPKVSGLALPTPSGGIGTARLRTSMLRAATV